jgi:hypothetical protein
MAKRRTRKDKETAKHTFTVSWNPEGNAGTVKSQKEKQTSQTSSGLNQHENSGSTGLILSLDSIKRDLIRSVSIGGFILAFELVIYFFWK